MIKKFHSFPTSVIGGFWSNVRRIVPTRSWIFKSGIGIVHATKSKKEEACKFLIILCTPNWLFLSCFTRFQPTRYSHFSFDALYLDPPEYRNIVLDSFFVTADSEYVWSSRITNNGASISSCSIKFYLAAARTYDLVCSRSHISKMEMVSPNLAHNVFPIL